MLRNTCSTHQETPADNRSRVWCHTCRRITIEAEVVTRTVEALLAAGYKLSVQYSGEPCCEFPPTTDQQKVLDGMMDVDEEFLIAYKPDTDTNDLPDGYIYFVYGNDGWDAIADYTTNLEPAIAPVSEWTERNSN